MPHLKNKTKPLTLIHVALTLLALSSIAVIACGTQSQTTDPTPDVDATQSTTETTQTDPNQTTNPDNTQTEPDQTTSNNQDEEPSQSSTAPEETTAFEGYGDSPGFAGQSFNAGTFDTRTLQGKPLVINFWFPSCPPCRAELPVFEEAYQTYGPPGGGDVHFVGIQQLGLDSIQDGIDLFKELGITFPGLPDTNIEIQIQYDIFSFPTTVFLDQNHNEVRKWQGALEHDTLFEIVESLVSTQSKTPTQNNEREEVTLAETSDTQNQNTTVAVAVNNVEERQFTTPKIFAGLGDATGFSGETFKHGTFDTSKLAGRPIVINFWYPSCPPCRAEIPNFEHAYQKYGTPGGGDVAFVGIQALGLDTVTEGEQFLEDIGATYPGLPDINGDIHASFQIIAAPTTFFLDREHNIVGVHQGYMRHDDLTEMMEFISADPNKI